MTYISYFDSKITVDRDNWAVTLICNSQCSGKDASCASSSGSNHAVLVVEKVKKSGLLFRQLMHLEGPSSLDKQENDVVFRGGSCYVGMMKIGKVTFSKRHKEEISYTHKSETWLRSADKVRVMRRLAKKQRDNPSEFPSPFSIFGDRSKLTKDLKVVQILNQSGVCRSEVESPFQIPMTFLKVFRVNNSLLSTIAKQDRNYFLYLYDCAKVHQNRDNYGSLFSDGSLITNEMEWLRFKCFKVLPQYEPELAYRLVKKVWQNGVKKKDNWIHPAFRDQFKIKPAPIWLTFITAPFMPKEKCEPWNTIISEDRMEEIQKLFAKADTVAKREKLSKHARYTEFQFFEDVKKRIATHFSWINKILLLELKKIYDIEVQSSNIKYDVDALTKAYTLHSYKLAGDKNAELLSEFSSLLSPWSRSQLEDPLDTYKKFLNKICECTNLSHVRPNSCFTWSRNMLKLIDVEIKHLWCEFLISPTKSYLTPVQVNCSDNNNSDSQDDQK